MSNRNIIRRKVQSKNINTREYLNKVYADTHWRDGYSEAILRIQKEVTLINEFPRRHLDVGCADGTFSKLLVKKFPTSEGWGIDISDVIIKDAENTRDREHFIAADCYDLPFENETFDLVHSGEMIEHLDDPEKAIGEMKRVLKPGGILILTTVNKFAAPDPEHIWYWNIWAVLEMVQDMDLVSAEKMFFGESILRVEAKKL